MKLLITCMYSLLFSALRTYWLLSDTHYLNTIIDCLLTYLLTAVHCAWTSHTGPGNSITKTRSSWLIWWLSKLSLFIVPGDRQSKQTKSGKSESRCQPYHTSHHPAVDRPGSDSPTCLLNDNGFLDSATLAVLSGCSCTILTMQFSVVLVFWLQWLNERHVSKFLQLAMWPWGLATEKTDPG